MTIPPYEPVQEMETVVAQENFALRAAAKLGLIKTHPVKIVHGVRFPLLYRGVKLGELSEWLASVSLVAPENARVECEYSHSERAEREIVIRWET